MMYWAASLLTSGSYLRKIRIYSENVSAKQTGMNKISRISLILLRCCPHNFGSLAPYAWDTRVSKAVFIPYITDMTNMITMMLPRLTAASATVSPTRPIIAILIRSIVI